LYSLSCKLCLTYKETHSLSFVKAKFRYCARVVFMKRAANVKKRKGHWVYRSRGRFWLRENNSRQTGWGLRVCQTTSSFTAGVSAPLQWEVDVFLFRLDVSSASLSSRP